MKIYTYTEFKSWRQIKSGSQEDHFQGLTPNTNLPLNFPEGPGRLFGIPKWNKGIFALLQPVPKEWTNNPSFTNVWSLFKLHVGKLLLDIEINPQEEGIYVGDWGYKEAKRNFFKTVGQIPTKYNIDSIAASLLYGSSFIPLNDFLKRKGELNYALPEVVMTKRIPLERVRISVSQPLLEERLRSEFVDLKEKSALLAEIKSFPELTTWLNSYLEADPELRQVSRERKI